MESIGIVIGTFGDEDLWGAKAKAMALPSAYKQCHDEEVTHVWTHDQALHRARNSGARVLDTDWLIFLDADDELGDGYTKAMREGEGDIRKPSTLGVYPDGTEDLSSTMIPERNLDISNHIIIGAMCRSKLFWEVGGFRNFPILEDWDLWRRMWKAGATVSEVPDAVYRVHVNEGSRNTDQALHDRVYQQIRRGK